MKASVIALICLVAFLVGIIAVSYLGSKEGFAGGPIGESNPRGTFTMYYADWCPHCQTAKPLFKDFMGTGIIQVNGLPIKLKMVEEKQIQKGLDPQVDGYPSFLYSDAAGKVVQFDGPRTPDGFMKFLETQIIS